MNTMGQVNLVQNGNFNGFSPWSGLAAEITGGPGTGVPGEGGVGIGGDIYQFIPTVIGDTYQISFYAGTQIDFGQYTIAVDINGNELAAFTTPGYTTDTFDNLDFGAFTSSFTASTASTRLEFVAVDSADGNEWLADVNTVAVPEPPTNMLIFMGATMVVSKTLFPKFWRLRSPFLLSGNTSARQLLE